MSQNNPLTFSAAESAWVPSGRHFGRVHLAYEVIPDEIYSESIAYVSAALEITERTAEDQKFEDLDGKLQVEEGRYDAELEAYNTALTDAAVNGGTLPPEPDPRRLNVLRTTVDEAAKTAERKQMDLRLARANKIVQQARAELASVEAAIAADTALALSYLSRRMRLDIAERSCREVYARRQGVYAGD